MRNTFATRVGYVIALGILCLVSACGGSDDGSATSAVTPPSTAVTPTPTPATYHVSGTVAYGKPVAGQIVQAVDSAGKTCAQATTAADGTYGMDTSACAPGSAAVSVSGVTTPAGAPLIAVAVPPPGTPVINGVVNVDPLTTLVAYDAAGMVATSSAAGTASQVLALLAQVSADQYAQAHANVLTPSLLQLLQGTYGVTAADFSAGTTPFSANGQGLDAFFDAFSLSAPSAASVQLAPASGPGISISVTLPTAATGSSSTTSGSTVVSNVSYAVGGSVTGLSGGSLTLLINGANALSISANGPFTFPTPVANTYAVTVANQPTGQVCSVGQGNGSGLNANVTNVAVTCSALTYRIGGSVTGLSNGDQVTLANNASDATVISSNGAFTFPTPVAFHGSYAVTVALSPVGKSCSVTSGSGSGITADVSSVLVTCSPNTFTIGGIVSGLNGSLTLLNNNGNSTTLVSDGAFTFSTPVVQGGTFNVTVGTQPATQTCSVSNGSGIVSAANITGITVSCSTVPRRMYVYEPGNNNNQLFGIAIDTNSGSVASVPNSPYLTASQSNASAMWVATDPAAKFLYAVNRNSGSIAGFTIDHSTGALTAMPGSPFATGASQPNGIIVNPAGTFAIVPNQGSGSVGVYAIDQTTGALTQVQGSPFAAGSAPSKAAISPNGSFVYVSNQNDHDISGYSIDPVSGSLLPLPGSPYAFSNASDSPLSLAITPAGTYLYALNGSGTINGFLIDATTGDLSALPNSPYSGSSAYGGRSITINATGTMAFVASGNGGPVLTFSLDSTTGAITQIGGTSYAAGQGPWYVALDPNGTIAYVSNALGLTLGVATIDPVTGTLTDLPYSPLGLNARSANIAVVQP